MGKRRSLRDVEYVRISAGHSFGKSNIDIAQELGISVDSVGNTIKAIEAVKSQNWEECCRLLTVRCQGIEAFNWAAEQARVELPESVVNAYESQRAKQRLKYAAEKAEQKKKAEPQPEPKPQPAPKPQPEPKPSNDVVYFIRILEELSKQNKLLTDLLDVVIPKYVEVLRNDINANADISQKQLEHCESMLDAIKSQHRKRSPYA